MNFLEGLMTIINGVGRQELLDPKFGLLVFSKITQDGWKGRTLFQPSNKEIEIYIFNIDREVSARHYQFYDDFQLKFVGIVDQIEALYLKSRPASESDFESLNTWRLGPILGIAFPDVKALSKPSFEWDIYFSGVLTNSYYVVEMEGWTPVDCYAEVEPWTGSE